MATKRKRWFKVADSIRREPWSNDELALAVRLMSLLNERWARDGKHDSERGSALISAGELCDLAGCEQVARARRVLDALATRTGLTWRADGSRTLIEWPKYVIFQGPEPRCRDEVGRESGSNTPPPHHAPRTTHLSDSESAPAGAESDHDTASFRPPEKPPAPEPRPKRERPQVPDDAAKFAEDFRAALAQVHPGTKPPTPAAFDAWRQEARKLLHVDRRPLEEAASLASWLFADPGTDAAFWRSNVLSLPTFRRQYDRLLVKQRANRTEVTRDPYGGSLLMRWAAQQ